MLSSDFSSENEIVWEFETIFICYNDLVMNYQTPVSYDENIVEFKVF